MMAMGVHCVDLLCLLLGQEVVEVTAITDGQRGKAPWNVWPLCVYGFRGQSRHGALWQRRGRQSWPLREERRYAVQRVMLQPSVTLSARRMTASPTHKQERRQRVPLWQEVTGAVPHKRSTLAAACASLPDERVSRH
jgi:hypothetical protein